MSRRVSQRRRDLRVDDPACVDLGIEQGDIEVNVVDEAGQSTSTHNGDRAMREYSWGKSLRDVTNIGTAEGETWNLPPWERDNSTFPVPESVRTARLPVPDFWTYDGAQPTLAHTGKITTSRFQVLPDKRIREQDAVEWQRVGCKKGWMFNGHPQQEGPGGRGEDVPSHAPLDGWIKDMRRWTPQKIDMEKQEMALRETPAVDIRNRARGTGMTSRGGGGMAGGYQVVNQERLSSLPIPHARFNWTGTRPRRTAREDQGGGELGSGAGGYRAGYRSRYATRPSYTAVSRVREMEIPNIR